MDPKVVVGEASESDDDEEKLNAKDEQLQSAVVEGEASESEEEEEENIITDQRQKELPPLSVDPNKDDEDNIIHSTDSIPTSTDKVMELIIPKYDSLLHRKLREKNAGLRRHLVDSVKQSYNTTTKDLHNISQQLHKSQASVMDSSYSMRHLTNDLFYLEDKIDIITTCTILPDVKLPDANSQ